ncbi:NADH-ubiquinone oxidoreductase-F iron-sulfur binding region domain-containing protein [Nocardia concava]|uniref:NADH-ubiquinone oxidoreductase-F iron-sulfur binding region domain-containing protein n=1 Tax=Nocardia concava TaxID=257281 RepID=UPI001C3F18F9|nr:NADH-ubiquinone oxidoreductase-F iron-sulfur binding region domain-containing protein [Nocardia concava]
MNATDRLREAHEAHGEVRRADMEAVARGSGLPAAAVAGAASFYADFGEGRGDRNCAGTGCFVARGGVLEAAGERTVYCLGCCYAAPAALIGGIAVTGPDSVPPPPIPYACAVSDPIVLAGLCHAAEPWQSWSTVLAWRLWPGLTAEVARSGLRGRGGAEYPVAAKWHAVTRNPGPRYVIANGDEGDPGSFCDRLLMEYDPHRVLEGLALCGCAVGATEGRVLVRSEYPGALAALRAAVDSARAAGHLGENVHGSGLDFDVVIQEGAGSYVAGEETALLRSLEGLRGTVQARPPYPTDYGYRGRPTVVQNIETLAAIPWIARHGGEAYARLGRRVETGTKLVSLNSVFERPGVYEVEFGTPLRRIVEDLGGGLRDGQRLGALQIGGPLGGFLGPDDLDIGFATADLAEHGVSLGHGGLVAIPDSVPPVQLLRHLWRFAARESCGSCAPCRVGSRRGLEISESVQALPAADETDLSRLLDIMRVGSMCAFGSGVADAVRSLLKVYDTSKGWQ